jgi:putative OPT family oligopeptide transporter
MATEAMRLRAGENVKELTIRGIILGAILTVILTAANVYAGLKIGLTVATSIPAAVVSMAVLRSFRDSTIQENNIVQTIASAAGTLSAIVFVLPGLVMVGWWTGFPYWLSVAVIAIGGILGVMYSVPLRRALVTGSDLPYPEGIAAAEVLKVGAGIGGAEENRRGLLLIVWSSLASALFYALAQTKLLAADAAKSFTVGSGATTVSASLSMLLIGVGHLVGLTVGIAMLVGLVISWGFLVPHYTALAGAMPAGTSLDDFVHGVFVDKVRFIGAGTIGVAAIWTLLKIMGPIISGIRGALAANRERKAGRGEALPITERDIPIGIVAISILVSMIPIGLLLYSFASTNPIAANPITTIVLSIIYVLIAGVVIAAVCGYMAGLIGASNSPISGVGILSVVGISLILALLFPGATGEASKSLVAFALFVTAVVFGVATISNNNLQDLKTGELVGATPWRQQVALVLGVVFGAVVIPPVLDLLNTAFTFQGVPGAKPNALAAPQAALISAIAQGLLNGNFDWKLIGYGAGIGVVVIIIDELLRKAKRGGLPPLAVGMGIYLPMALTLLVPLGAFLGWLYDRWAATRSNAEFAQRMGVLLATGLIVGESIMGVIYASVVAATQNDAPFALMTENPWAVPAGIIVFLVVILGFYAWTRREAAMAPVAGDDAPTPESTYR